jgi:hypothetical protein
MIKWLFRFLSVATTGTAQNPVATKDVRLAESTRQRERPLVVDESTAMAELMRLLDKQSETGKAKSHRKDQSDS